MGGWKDEWTRDGSTFTADEIETPGGLAKASDAHKEAMEDLFDLGKVASEGGDTAAELAGMEETAQAFYDVTKKGSDLMEAVGDKATVSFGADMGVDGTFESGIDFTQELNPMSFDMISVA